MLDEMGSASLKLPVTLDLAAAEGFLDDIRDRLQADPRLRIDASEVETLTLPCVQILLAAHRSYDLMSIEHPSAAFVCAFADIGLESAELCRREGEPLEPNPDPVVNSDEALEPNPNPVVNSDAPLVPLEQPMAKRILTIDDSKTIRDMLMLTLADAGFEVLQAVDGQDGLDVLSKQPVDVVITDINMPRMDGYEVIRQMRRNSAHKTIPILVLTTESESDKKNLAREAGATGWMVKPFDPDRLIATINKVAH
jgi:two-component system, chemotaxis family, chemotaxis protein CheY